MRRLGILALGAAFLLGLGEMAAAQDAGKAAAREREIMRRALAAQKQAESDRDRLAQEKEAAESKLQGLQQQQQAAESAVTQERKRAAALQAKADTTARDLETTRRERERLSARVAELEEALRTTQGELAASQARTAKSDETLTRTRAALESVTGERNVCLEKNVRLYDISAQLLEKYRAVTVWDVLKRREPFTKAERVEVGNLLEELRSQADDARLGRPK